MNSGKVFSDVWQCYGKWTGKHFLVFGYVMENEPENNLLMNFFFQVYLIYIKYLLIYNKKIKSKKYNDNFFLLYSIFIHSLFYKI